MATCPSGHESASDDFCDVCGFRIGAGVFTQTGASPVVTGPGNGPGSPGGSGIPGAAPAVQPGAQPAVQPGKSCPRCGAERVGQFCESCGYSFAAGGQPAPQTTAAPAMPPPAPAPAPPAPASGQPAAAPAFAAPAFASPASAAVSAPESPQYPPPPPAAAAWTAVVTADRDYFDSVQAANGPDAGDISFPAYCPERRFRLSGPQVRVGRRSVSRGIDPEIDLTGPPADPGVSRLHALLVAAPDGTWSVVDPGSANGTLVNGDEIPQGLAVPLHDGDRIHLGAWTALTITREA